MLIETVTFITTALGQPQPSLPISSFVLRDDIVVFPLKLVNAFPFIQGSVNGQLGYFMFDTGNPDAISLNSHYLTLPTGQVVGEGFVGSGQRYTCTSYPTIDSIGLSNGLRYRSLLQVEGNTFDFLERIMPTCLGQVGFGFVDGYILKLDYTQRLMTCYRATKERGITKDFLLDEQVVGILNYEVRKLPGEPLINASCMSQVCFEGIGQ